MAFKLPDDEETPATDASRQLLTTWLAALIDVTGEPLERSRAKDERPVNWRRVTIDDPDLPIEINVGQPVTMQQRDRLKKLISYIKRII